MKIKLLLSASLLAVCAIASAQSVVEITDPAKIAEIERHAQQLGAQPMAAPGDHMRGEGMHGDRRHMRHHRKHMRAMHNKKMDGDRAAMKTPPDMAAPPPPPAAK